MPARNPDELPEGTDHIVNGAMETNGTMGGASGGTGTSGTGGFVASGNSTGTDDTGGNATGIKGQIRQGAQSLKSQATDRVRNYAVDGKDRVTGKLDDLSRIVEDAARSIDERLGSEYGDYARKAATYVTDFSSNIRNKEVDELVDDAKALIRKSPAAAIGIAAVVGFTLVRIVKAGLDESGASSNGSRATPREEA
ncbi:hypothetical protein IC614_03895 [Allosphingosinicella flava]|uniref:CsbD family protein n=1 Tax=Allosphingosinicella flava TaxID=2771430 RepID=A0A7T2GKV8_9SPHN|nr:hypothetical protein [Sphingosinicella flava]QPQ55741.1 hypothetical protein IC614_03895 [Sphingosinicella flava]